MTAERPELRTLADRVNWLIKLAHRAGGRPMSDAELAEEIWRVTGQRFSRSAIWKLRTGQTLHPTFELIEGLARALGVPTDWFSGKMDEARARELEAQVMLLAQLRDSGVTSVHLHTMRDADPGTRDAIIKFLELAARPPASEPREGGPHVSPENTQDTDTPSS